MAKNKKAAKKASKPSPAASKETPVAIVESSNSDQAAVPKTVDVETSTTDAPKSSPTASGGVEEVLNDLETPASSKANGESKYQPEEAQDMASEGDNTATPSSTHEPHSTESPTKEIIENAVNTPQNTSDTVEAAKPKTNGHAHTESKETVDTPASEQTSGSTGGEAQLSKVSALEAVIAELKQQLEATESERDDIQEEYDGLLEKVGTIRTRFKELHSEKEAAKSEIVTLKSVAEEAKKEAERSKSEIEKAQQEAREAKDEAKRVKQELETSKSQADQLKSIKEQTDVENEVMKRQLVTQKVMFDQEVLDERAIKDALEIELEQTKSALEESKAQAKRSTSTVQAQEKTIAGLEAKLAAATRDAEARESAAAASQEEIQAALSQAQTELKQVRTQLASLSESSQGYTQRQEQLEQDAKQKQLLIGKLRHEAVILNDHLTHALRLVRQDSEGSTVDKELVSNLFVQYATCPRADTKKYEILLLIANFLDWDENRRQLVGLSKPQEPEGGDVPQPPQQMVGVVGKLAEFLENRRNGSS